MPLPDPVAITTVADEEREREAARKGINGLPLKFSQRHASERVRIRLRDKMRTRLMATVGDAGLTRLPTLPGVQSLALATRYMPGGRQRFIEYVQFAALNDHDIARKWLFVYDDLILSEQKVVSFDDICAASGVRPSELMALVVGTAMEYGIDVGNLVAAAGHPEVVAKSLESATRISGKGASIGLRDREMLFQHQNFIASPKGPSVHVHASANAQAAAAVDADPSVPSFASTMHGLRAALPAGGSSSSDIIDTTAITGDKVTAVTT